MSLLRWNTETTFQRKDGLGWSRFNATLSLWSPRKGSSQERATSSEMHLTDVISTRKATLWARTFKTIPHGFKEGFLQGRMNKAKNLSFRGAKILVKKKKKKTACRNARIISCTELTALTPKQSFPSTKSNHLVCSFSCIQQGRSHRLRTPSIL